MTPRSSALVLLALTTSACASGTTPYSDTISPADRSYARETVLHLGAAALSLDDVPRRLFAPSTARVGLSAPDAMFVRRARADVEAVSGVMSGAGFSVPDLPAVREHGREHPEAVTPEPLARLDVAAQADRAAVRRSADYMERARSATLKNIARRAIDRRSADTGVDR